MPALLFMPLPLALPEVQSRQNGCAFQSHRIQLLRIEAKRFQDGRRNLVGLDAGINNPGSEVGVGDQHDDVGVVMREAAMLHQFRGTSRVDHSHVWGDDDVRCAWIAVGWQTGEIVVEPKTGAVEYLANASLCGIFFKNRYS